MSVCGETVKRERVRMMNMEWKNGSNGAGGVRKDRKWFQNTHHQHSKIKDHCLHVEGGMRGECVW